MKFCPRCDKPGYRLMGAGDFCCVDHECRCEWHVDDDGRSWELNKK